jgi:hypothetical protein
VNLTPGAWFLPLVVVAAPVPMAVAADYLSVTEAQHAVFPEATGFRELPVLLTAAQREQVLALAGVQPPHGLLRVWVAERGKNAIGHFLMDEVVGRQDFIDYALGINPDGSLRTLEIMSYRESHGAEVRNAAWRRQFAQRSSLQQLRFQTDIKNIAGATMSCEHVTAGVRMLRAYWQSVLQPSGP